MLAVVTGALTVQLDSNESCSALDALLDIVDEHGHGDSGSSIGDAVRRNGGVPRLINLLELQTSQAPKALALTLLGNLCCSAVDKHAAQTRSELLAANGAQVLMRLLRSDDEDSVCLTAATLQNLLAEPAWASYLEQLEGGAIVAYLEELCSSSSNPAVVRYASGSLVNLRSALEGAGKAAPIQRSGAAEQVVRDRQNMHTMETLRPRWARRRILAAVRMMPASERERRSEAARKRTDGVVADVRSPLVSLRDRLARADDLDTLRADLGILPLGEQTSQDASSLPAKAAEATSSTTDGRGGRVPVVAAAAVAAAPAIIGAAPTASPQSPPAPLSASMPHPTKMLPARPTLPRRWPMTSSRIRSYAQSVMPHASEVREIWSVPAVSSPSASCPQLADSLTNSTAAGADEISISCARRRWWHLARGSDRHRSSARSLQAKDGDTLNRDITKSQDGSSPSASSVPTGVVVGPSVQSNVKYPSSTVRAGLSTFSVVSQRYQGSARTGSDEDAPPRLPENGTSAAGEASAALADRLEPPSANAIMGLPTAVPLAVRWSQAASNDRVGVPDAVIHAMVRGRLKRWQRHSLAALAVERSHRKRECAFKLHLRWHSWHHWRTVTHCEERELLSRSVAAQEVAALRGRMRLWRQLADEACRQGDRARRERLDRLRGDAAAASCRRTLLRLFGLWSDCAQQRKRAVAQAQRAVAQWREQEINFLFCRWTWNVMRMAEEDREGPAVWLERRQRSRAQAQRRRLLRGWAAVRARGEAKQAIQAELAARRRAAMARDQAALFLWRTQAIGAVFCALHALSDLVRERRALRQTMVQCVSRRRINHLTFTWGVWFCRITVLLEGRHLCHIYDERSSMHLVRHRTLLGWQSLLTPLKVARWSHFGSSALRRLLSRSWGRWHGKLADRLRRQRDSMVIAPQLLSMRARHAAVHTRRTFVKWKRRKRRGYLQRLNLRDNAVSSGYGLQGRFGVRSRTHVQPLPRACAGSPGQYLDWGGARYAERAQHGRRRRINALMNDAPGPQAHKLPQITSPRTLVRAHSPNPRDGAAYRATLVEARTTQYDGSASSAPSIDQLIMAAKEFLTSGALTTTASHQPLPFTSNFAQF